MRISAVTGALVSLALFGGCAGGRIGSGRPKIYIVTDLEGASGVYKFAQTREPGPANDRACEYLMGDLDAVIRGLRDAGAGEIVVWDGHGSGAFVPHLLSAGARYITGRPGRGPMPELDETFAGLVQLGAHAMMGTPDGVLHHTQSSRTENRYWYNDIESGELAQCALIAGHYGVPTILVTGDEATCREARRFFGPECVTVAVKRGLAREGAVLYPFDETRRALYEGARRAVGAIPRCRPYRLPMPIRGKLHRLEFDKQAPDGPGRPTTREATFDDARRILDF